jgi:hypothetical protein
MSGYVIDHSCGHMYDHPGYADDGLREWMSQRVCPDCRRAQLSRAAAATNEQAGLPPLTGSKKQVAWAETLREKAVNSSTVKNRGQVAYSDHRHLAPLAAKLGVGREAVEARRVAIEEAAQQAIDTLLSHTEARWWIDNRHSDVTRPILEARYAEIQRQHADVLAHLEMLRLELNESLRKK